jgi:ammonia channel protein AmtB
VGVLLTGVLASLAVNAAGANGGWTQLGRQAILAVTGIAYPFIGTLIVLWVTDRLVGLRLSAGDEDLGLDLSQLTSNGNGNEAVIVASAGADRPKPLKGGAQVAPLLERDGA